MAELSRILSLIGTAVKIEPASICDKDRQDFLTRSKNSVVVNDEITNLKVFPSKGTIVAGSRPQTD